MSADELVAIKAKIADAENKLKKAEDEGEKDLISGYLGNLIELRKEKNYLESHSDAKNPKPVVDVNSSIVICRALLESQVMNYIKDHVKYANNTKGAKCKDNISKYSVSDALDHMQCCPGQLDTWKFFKSNSKLFTSAPGRVVYSALSESVHNAYAKENTVHIPEWLDPIPKRFLLRLFTVLQYCVKVFDKDGNVRDPVSIELESPKKRVRAESSSDESTAKVKKSKKDKKDKKAKKDD